MRTFEDIYNLIYLNTKATKEQAIEIARYCHNHKLDGIEAIKYAEKVLNK